MKKTVIYKKIESGKEEKYEYENPADEGGKSVDYSDLKDDELRIIRYDTGKPGKNLLVFGAVHGNEICGPKTIAKVSKEIDSGEIQLESGSITFVPVCNPVGYLQNTRASTLEENLNRHFTDEKQYDSYECKIANHLKELIDKSTELLDIHSYSSEGPHFAFYDVINKDLCDFAKAQNFQVIMCNFPGMFKGVDNSSCGYSNRHHIPGVTIESGQHTDPACLERAYAALKNSIAFLGISNEEAKSKDSNYYNFIFMEEKQPKKSEGKFAKIWNHLDEVKKGEPIFIEDNGETYSSEKDCLILMPNKLKKIAMDDDLYFLGRRIEEPQLVKGTEKEWMQFKPEFVKFMQDKEEVEKQDTVLDEPTTRNAQTTRTETVSQSVAGKDSTTKDEPVIQVDKSAQSEPTIQAEPSIKKTKLSLVQNANGSGKDITTSTKQKTKELTGP